jgi:hypothetical protein
VEILPRTRQNAFNVTAPPRVERALSTFPPPGLAAGEGGLAPLSPAADRGDVGLELDRLLAALASQTIERRSQTTLDLDTSSAEQPSRLTSIAQLNDAATSYEKVRLTFGNSSTVATLSGVYAAGGAAAGAKSLRIEFTDNATIGHSAGPLKFKVVDHNDQVVYTHDGNAKAGEQLSLGSDIGLQVSFSAGSARSGDGARTTVSATAATTVDTGARFNDADVNLRPRFAGGAQVVAGSFLINGVTIQVREDDSVADVLQRISESEAGVTAEVQGDKVVLQTRADSGADISISNDSSGFLDAVQLRGAVTERGHLRADQETLANLKQFAAVQSGGFSVNGQFVSINPATDTLAGTLARIRSALPLQAYYDAGQGAVFLREPEGDISFGEDSSGFLTAVGITREAQRSLDPTLQLAPQVAQRVARLLDGNLASLATESAREPEPATPKEKPAAARRAQTAYLRETTAWARTTSGSSRLAAEGEDETSLTLGT